MPMKSIAVLFCLAAAVGTSGCKRRGPKETTPAETTVTGGKERATATVPVADPKAVRKPNFTISKETTYVTEPVDSDGCINYADALNERLSKGVTPANNANVLLWKAMGPKPELDNRHMPAKYFQLIGIEEPPENGEYFIRLKKYMRGSQKNAEKGSVESIEEELKQTARYPWTANDHPDITEWLKANDKPLALAIEASKRPEYYSPVGFGWASQGDGRAGILASNDPVLMQCRWLAYALASRAMSKLGDGRHDEAWQDLLACHRLARLTAKGGHTISGIVGTTIEQISQRADLAFIGQLTDSAAVLRYRRDLQALPSMPSLADEVDSAERFELLQELMFVIRHGLKYLEALSGGKNDAPPGPVEKVDWDDGLRFVNRWFDNIVAALREEDRPTRQKRLALIDEQMAEMKAKRVSEAGREEIGRAALDLQITPRERGLVFTELVLGLMKTRNEGQHVLSRSGRAEQDRRNLFLAFALAAYKCDNKSYPKSLDALIPRYLDKVPDDFFTGNPLVYQPSENGYLLYSLGPNGEDDAGRSNDDDPKGDDIAVRMPVSKPIKK